MSTVFFIILIIFLVIFSISGWVFALWVNDDWFKDCIKTTEDWCKWCQELNEDWGNYCIELAEKVDRLRSELAEKEQINP